MGHRPWVPLDGGLPEDVFLELLDLHRRRTLDADFKIGQLLVAYGLGGDTALISKRGPKPKAIRHLTLPFDRTTVPLRVALTRS